MPRAHGCAGAACVSFAWHLRMNGYVQEKVRAGTAREAGLGHAHDCRDAGGRAPRVGARGDAGAVAEERCLTSGLAYVQDERYAAGAWMRRSGLFQVCTVHLMTQCAKLAQSRRTSMCSIAIYRSS